MENLTRRDALGTLVGTGSTLALAALSAARQANGAEGPVSGIAIRGLHQPKPLPFDPAKLKGISEKVIRSHWENNYQGAMKTLNQLEHRLDAFMQNINWESANRRLVNVQKAGVLLAEV